MIDKSTGLILLVMIFGPLSYGAINPVGTPAKLTPHQYFDPARNLKIEATNSTWEFFAGDVNSRPTSAADLKLQFVARAPAINDSGVQPTFTLRVDSGEWKSAKQYAIKWLKEYPKFGYELQLSQEAAYGALKGFEMVLSSGTSERYVRQFIVNRPGEIWVFTCSADKAHFVPAWQACQKILNTAQIGKEPIRLLK